jgi:hypothetical protein
MSKIVYPRAKIEILLNAILNEMPQGYKVLLVLDNGEKNSWIIEGDLDYSVATQTINAAMVQEDKK